jgi:hypothetical protein
MVALDWLMSVYVPEWLMQAELTDAAGLLAKSPKISNIQDFPIKVMAKAYLDTNQAMNRLNMSGMSGMSIAYVDSGYASDIFSSDDILEPLLHISLVDAVVRNMIRNTIHNAVCIAIIKGVDIEAVKQTLDIRLFNEAYYSIVLDDNKSAQHNAL